MSPGVIALLVAVAFALALGLYRAAADGRFRGTHRIRGVVETEPGPVAGVLAGTPWEGELGATATLLQFSSAFCAPCRATRRVLHDAAGQRAGVAHVEIDAEHHLDLVRRLGILRTPTTLVLDAQGQEVTRAAGAPTRQQVLDTLDQLARRSG